MQTSQLPPNKLPPKFTINALALNIQASFDDIYTPNTHNIWLMEGLKRHVPRPLFHCVRHKTTWRVISCGVCLNF